MNAQRSTVKWFDPAKGFGFILNPDGGKDLFVHHTQIVTFDDFRTLEQDQEVEFVIEDSPQGPAAVNVRAI